jgi:hypothetical protein
MPPGDADSEERALWVKSRVRQHLAGTPLRQLRQRQLECWPRCGLRRWSGAASRG